MLRRTPSLRLKSSGALAIAQQLRTSHSDSTGDALWRQWYDERFRNGLVAALGIDLVHVRPRRVALRMDAAALHMNPLGVAHGGSLGALADTALGLGCHLATNNVNPRERAADSERQGTFAVMNLNVDFLAPVRQGDSLLATAEQTHAGKRSQAWAVTVTRESDGKTVCSARGLALNLKQSDTLLVGSAACDASPRETFAPEILAKMGKGFQMERMDKSDIERRFDKLSERWESYVEKLGYVPVFHWLTGCANALSRCAREAGDHVEVLDLACGIGLIAKCVRSGLRDDLGDVRMTGVDISTGMLAKALHAGVYTGGVLRHDLEETFPLDSEKYDIVTFCGASELLDMSLVMPEVRRVTRAGGVLWITFQHQGSNEKNPTAHQSIQGMSEEEAHVLLRSHGFEVLSSRLEPRAFVTPQPDGKEAVPVPYLFVVAKKKGAE